jgi:hypothetical protein
MILMSRPHIAILIITVEDVHPGCGEDENTLTLVARGGMTRTLPQTTL